MKYKKPECTHCGKLTFYNTQYTPLEKEYGGILCMRCLPKMQRSRCSECNSTDVVYATGKNAETKWMCSICHKEINAPEYVYFVLFAFKDFRAVKIGKSEKEQGVEGRVKYLQTASPINLTLLGYIRGSEYKLHKRFKEHRLNNEWFTYDLIKNEIEEILNSEKGKKTISRDITSPKM